MHHTHSIGTQIKLNVNFRKYFEPALLSKRVSIYDSYNVGIASNKIDSVKLENASNN